MMDFDGDILEKNCALEEYVRGRDRMLVGFTNTCVISAYHH